MRPCTILFPLAAVLAGCAADPAGPLAYDPVRVGEAGEPLPPEFVPALEALEQAVRDGDEAVARSILASIHARQPKGRTLELARGFERILDGRVVARGLELRLVAEERIEPRGTYSILLSARHPLDEPVLLQPAAARLRQLVTTVDPRGAEQRSATSHAVEELLELELPPGEELRVELAELALPPVPGILAIRAHVTLELLPGGLTLGERALPAQELPVAPVECVRLAGFLPTAAVQPAELRRYVLEERVRRPALMERAVRIAPARRAEALDLLAGSAEQLSLPACEDLVPALRWLSGDDGPGGDPAAWRAWLLARADRGESRAARLDVPEAGS